MEDKRESEELPDARRVFEAQLRNCFGRAAYSHKTHEKCADIYHGRLCRLKLLQIVLAGITTGGLFVVIFGDSRPSAILAACTSTLLLILSTYVKERDLGELSQKHANAAGDLWDVRESYLSLLTDLQGGQVDLAQIRTQRDQLQEDLKSIYQAAPRTIPKAYSEAQKALQLKEDLTFTDAEIDNMLPTDLRKMAKEQ